MNSSTSTPTVTPRETSPSCCGRLESIALGLLVLGTCLPAMWPRTAFKAEAPKPSIGDEAVHHPMATGGSARTGSEDRRSSAPRIRRLPTTLIIADAIAAETDSAPGVLGVETVPTVEIVPLATLQPNPPTLP